MLRYIVGITGASGSIYLLRLLEELCKLNCQIYLISTDNGKKVFEHEIGYKLMDLVQKLNNGSNKIKICNIDDMFSSVASGSFKTDGMIIVPCSMSTVAKLSHGISDNLLLRASDVMIKEKRKLIVVPRETPLNSIHLKNLLSLSNLNVTIIPPMPAFYMKPKNINDIVNGTIGRCLDALEIKNHIYSRWKENE